MVGAGHGVAVSSCTTGLHLALVLLGLGPGDEVVTSTQDYPHMISTWRQRERRDGIVLRQVSLPVPAEDGDEVVRIFERALTPKTKLILVSHLSWVTGQVLPVRGVMRMARARGIPVIVDGAHSFAHFPFTRDELGCDYYASSLHKWLFAPHGTGLLYVRRDGIRELWPLQAAEAHIEVNTMASAAGLQLPDTQPLLHFSRRQDVVVWPLTKVDHSRAG